MIKLIKSFVVVFLFIFCFSYNPTPIIDMHFTLPVLTGIPKREQISSVIYVPISEENEEMCVILTRLSLILEMIFLPPNKAPNPSTKPIDKQRGKIDTFPTKSILNR